MRRKDEQRIREIFREELRGVVQEELNAALTRTIKVEKSPPDGESYRTTEEWNVLDWLVHYIPYLEGALRGCQADVDKAKNQTAENATRIQALGQTVVGMEEAARSLVELRDSVRRITESPGLVVREALLQQGERELAERLGAPHERKLPHCHARAAEEYVPIDEEG
jgi:hypothetical protein